MQLEPDKPSGIRNGSDTVRVIASLVVFSLAVLLSLVVLDVIPRDAFSAVASKAVMLTGIVVATAAAIALLSRR
jgi:membrane protein YdbS with pleckstrin-like domain